MHIRTVTTPVVAAAAILLLSMGAVFAQEGDYADDVDFGVSILPEDPGPGDTVEASVVGAVPGEELEFVAEINPEIARGTVEADASGNADFSFDIPEDAPEGELVVRVTGSESGDADDATVPLATPVDVDDDPITEDDELPETGADTSLLLLGGLLLAAVGGGAVIATRRRRESVDT